ncbi:MAG: hypothetical protein PHU51_03085 [Candidatus Nanoarchaeia archaeon]|nr:hypothetical protein [Candidatus Nanoarchaeia archaeon]
MSINQTYQQIFDYYSDIKRTDDLKGLCESKFLNRELITDLINYAANKNQEYTLYFIGKNIPVFEGDLSFAEPFEFINNYGFDPKYLSVLPKAIGINEYLTFYYLREKNFEITVLQALYLSNPVEYQKFFKKILEENKIVDDEQKEIKQIKINYLEKKKDLTEKKKIEKLLAEEIKEIEKILSKANFQKIKDVLQSFKTPDQEKYAVTDKVIPSEFYTLKKVTELDGQYKSIGRYLFRLDKKYNEIDVYDLDNAELLNHHYSKIDISDKHIAFFEENDAIFYTQNGFKILKRYKNKISFDDLRGLLVSILAIFFGAFGLSLIFHGISLEKINFEIIIFSILWIIVGIVGVFGFKSFASGLIYKKEQSLKYEPNSNYTGISTDDNIIKLIIADEDIDGTKLFFNNNLIVQSSNTKIYEFITLETKYSKSLLSDNSVKFSLNKDSDIMRIRHEAVTQLSNTTDADQIVKINIQTKDKIKNLIDFSYVLGILKSVSSEELVDKTKGVAFDRMIKYCFTLKNENLNNYILDTCNRKRIRLSNDNILGLISENQCDKELLNTNMTVIENIESVEFILKNIKMTQLHKVFILNTLNRLWSKHKGEEILIQLCNMRSTNMMNLIKTTQGDYDAFLLNKVEVLINQYGSSSSTIEITENGNSNSKDIEVK